MDRYSRVVAFLKVLLPLAALALLSTLFLLSRSVDPTSTLPFSEAEVEARLSGQQITRPFFAGVTDRGDRITLAAEMARPETEAGPASAEGITARISPASGGLLTVEADAGRADTGSGSAEFVGNVRFRSSTGYELTSDLIRTALDEVDLRSPGPVRGTGPLGQLDAGAMEITGQGDANVTRMLFKNGVKLVYEPSKSER